VILRSPVIRNDSITQSKAEPCQIVAYQRTECEMTIPSVALDEVAHMEVREVHYGLKIVGVIGLAAFVIALWDQAGPICWGGCES
jgi:hypothetical protein